MYKLKTIPSDFVVEELAALDLEALDQSSGKFLYLALTKENWTTLAAVKELSRSLCVNLKDINFAGTKDKHAVTRQVVSVKIRGQNLHQKFPLKLAEGITATCLGYGPEPLSLGFLKGNKFTITLRNLESSELMEKRKYFVNYFDEQRFSTNNVKIGRLIVKKDFLKAATLIDDMKVNKQLALEPTNAVKALNLLNRKLLMFFIHAYQSYLWNETVSRYLLLKYGKECKKLKYSQGELVLLEDTDLLKLVGLEIPLLGALPLPDSIEPLILTIIEKLMEEEKLSRFDFIIKQFSNMTPEGDLREVVSQASQLKVSAREEDELHTGKEKQTISFELLKGNYATMFIKHFF